MKRWAAQIGCLFLLHGLLGCQFFETRTESSKSNITPLSKEAEWIQNERNRMGSSSSNLQDRIDQGKMETKRNLGVE